MTQTASNYGTVLFELGVKKEIVEKTKEIFSQIGRASCRERVLPDV